MKNLIGCTIEELENLAVNYGQAAFRGRQIYQWIYNYKNRNKSLDQINVLPLEFRNVLKSKGYNHGELNLKQRILANDGTLKLLLQTWDNQSIESVGIPTDNRLTACLSSQVGCPMDCQFCATGKEGLKRSLKSSEIIDQLLLIESEMDQKVSNIVFMGMGEPLLNYKNVVKAINKMKLGNGLNFSAKRITISTSGIPKGIKNLANENLNCNLAVSLHSAIQETREKIMPFSKKFPLEELMESLKYWYSVTKKKILYEYIIFDGINDDFKHVKALAKICEVLPCKVNFIEYNPIGDKIFRPSRVEKLQLYQKYLTDKGIVNTFRISRGRDINAACGQLVNLNGFNL